MTSRNWALIKDGKVINKIVADISFIESIKKDFDLAMDLKFVTEEPNIGSDYDPENNDFHNPSEVIDMKSDLIKYNKFKRFIISEGPQKYLIRMIDQYIDIGCKRYNASWIHYAFKKILLEEVREVGVLKRTSLGGVEHDSFMISPVNMEKIINQIEGVMEC